jgi:hypothetical protein
VPMKNKALPQTAIPLRRLAAEVLKTELAMA